MTGDLGFGFLEPLQQRLGDRFINVGVAEQSMVSIAAGLATCGLDVWVYSIASFCFSRPFEQIRNDICLQSLPVRLVGNGGGYGYGVMGGSHHAIEDYGVLLTLRGMRAFIPAFSVDIDPIVERQVECPVPTYLRLGRCEAPPGYIPPPYAPWRLLCDGPGPVVVVVGPLVGPLISAVSEMPSKRKPQLWVLGELPVASNPMPELLLESVAKRGCILIAEEHVPNGSAGQMMAVELLKLGLKVRFEHVCALGYPSGRYGSQEFHRRECGLDAKNLVERIQRLGECI